MDNDSQQFRILVIDDNPTIHDDFRKILAFSNPDAKEMERDELVLFENPDRIFNLPKYSIDSAYQGENGLQMVETSLKEKQPYAVMFVDIRMPPGWDGLETIFRIWKVDSEIQTVICTAYSDYSWEEMYRKFGETDRLLILKKPFDNIEIRQFVITLTKKWYLAKQVRHQLDFLQTTVDRRTAELRNSFSLLRATFESTADGILVTNMQDEIVDYNSKFINLWKVPKAILEPRKFSNLLGFMMNQLEYPEVFLKRMREFYKRSAEECFDLLKFKDKKIFECYSQPQKVSENIIGRVWNFRDITERRHLEEQLSYQATHDVLTGLSNRAMLIKHVEKSIEKAKEKNAHAVILFFDLDHFKLVNDTLGHSDGDKLLKVVASRMKQCIKPNDTLARLGGDEFVVLIDSLFDEHEIKDIMMRFFDSLKMPFNIDGNILNITASAGISIYPKDGKIAEVLFKNADAAMYRAKAKGRNNFQFFTASMNLHTAERLELSNDLNKALANNELLVYYQPLLDLKNKDIIGVEALVRWQHPKRGLLFPFEFIPIAEETGSIIPIGDWVMQTACKQVKAWHDHGIPDIWVAVNVSVNQFKHGNIIKTVNHALELSGLESKYLCLELTENLILEDTSEIKETLTELKELGVTISIEDFGVGYSNLNYITKFSIDRLKIDKSFMRDIITDESEAAIVLAILGIAKGLNMKVVAEGVETNEQLKFLQENKCDEFQGFLVSKPVDAEKCEEMLRSKNKK